MKEDTLAFVQYVLANNQITSGFDLDALAAHAEFLRQKGGLIWENNTVLQYEPIFSYIQRPFTER
jgi:hypothetical protein